MAFPGGDLTVIVGYESKIRINGILFAVKSGSLRYSADVHESGDTSKGEFKFNKAGRKSVEFSCEFHEPSFTNFHTAFHLVNEGDVAQILVYRDGNTLDIAPDFIPFLVIESYSVNISLDGIVSGSISGRASGIYFKKGEISVPLNTLPATFLTRTGPASYSQTFLT